METDEAPDPEGFSGTGNSLDGAWVELDYYDPEQAGSAEDTDDDGDIQDEMGYDELGFATQAQQDELFIEAGGFQFSRPEDVAVNPEDGTVAVLSSTGRGGLYPGDNWGSTYLVDTEFDESRCSAYRSNSIFSMMAMMRAMVSLNILTLVCVVLTT